MWNRLISILEEQALTLIRTAFSTSVREAGDLSAGVFDREGRMVAQAVTGTPGHVNTMAAAIQHFINDIGPERIYPGDIYLTNDPWKGTGHLHDITVVTPVFSSGLPPDIRGNLHGHSAPSPSPQEAGTRAQGERARVATKTAAWGRRPGVSTTSLVSLPRLRTWLILAGGAMAPMAWRSTKRESAFPS